MKIKSILMPVLLLSILGLSSTASAGFNFGSPFDVMDNNDNRYNRGYGGDRWDQYDQWEPNYWRYRYFEGDSRDNFFDEFNGNSYNNGRSRGQGRGRGGSDFGINADSRYNGQYDGNYEGDSRYRGERSRRYDYDRPPSRRSRAGQDYSTDQAYSGRKANKRQPRSAYDYYGNGYRQGANRYENGRYQRDRGISETPERLQQRAERKAKQPAECR